MTKSNYIYANGVAVDVGAAGDTDIAFANGESVTNVGGSPFVFEAGIGLGAGFEFTVDMSASNEIRYAQDESGNDQTFSAGTYTLQVEGNGWSHQGGSVDTSNLGCDGNPSGLNFYAPCSRVNPTPSDDTYAMTYDFDGDGSDETVYGPAIVYPGAPRSVNTPEGVVDAVPCTEVFTTKSLSVPSSGSGEITLDESGKIGVYNMDTSGDYDDNAADVTYTLVA